MFADSRDVADRFGKQHSHVLRGIRDVLTGLPKGQSTFGWAEYADYQGKKRTHCLMDRDGFMLLVMGFTGKRALEWKLADSDEAGQQFQYEAGHRFRDEAGQGSDLMPAT